MGCKVFQSPDPTRDGRTITVAETLDNAVKKLETDLAAQPARRAELQWTLGYTYRALGLLDEAIALLEKVANYHVETHGKEHPKSLFAMSNLALCYGMAGGRTEEVIGMQEEIVAISGKVFGPEDGKRGQSPRRKNINFTKDGKRGQSPRRKNINFTKIVN